MKNYTIELTPTENYQTPFLRIIETRLEASFLLSNTEPIDDDGQEHGWD